MRGAPGGACDSRPAGKPQRGQSQVSGRTASAAKTEPYKTHLAYVKERRTDEEAAQLLEEALEQLRARRGGAAG